MIVATRRVGSSSRSSAAAREGAVFAHSSARGQPRRSGCGGERSLNLLDQGADTDCGGSSSTGSLPLLNMAMLVWRDGPVPGRSAGGRGDFERWSATRTTAVRAMAYAERHSHRWSAREPSMPGGTMPPLVARGAACRSTWCAGTSSGTRAACCSDGVVGKHRPSKPACRCSNWSGSCKELFSPG